MNTTITPTKTRCEGCNKPIKHVYEWNGQTLGIECWKQIALPALEAERAAQREMWAELRHVEDQALVETLRVKDYSKIRSEFKLTFLNGLVEQWDNDGFISFKQKEMVYGTGAWNGSFYDYGMLNDTDRAHEAVFLFTMGNEQQRNTAVNSAGALPTSYQEYFKQATGANI